MVSLRALRSVGAASVVTLALLLITTGVAAGLTMRIVHDQERQLLKERTSEVAETLNASIDAVPTELASLGTAYGVSGDSARGFDETARADVVAGTATLGFVLVRDTNGDYQAIAAVGDDVRVGQRFGGAAAQAMAAAVATPGRMTVTGVIGAGAQRVLGFAFAPPAGPAGIIVYRQTQLGRLSAPREAQTAPFHEVRVALYAAPRVEAGQILVATTQPPLRGAVDYLPLPAGTTHWLLAVSAVHPLVDSVAANAPAAVLVFGVIGALLIAAVIEIEVRRRRAALGLYAGERRVAEALQRSLLPSLPHLDGLETATRYLPGEQGQRVGGDWFDAFEVQGGGIGIVIGDVIGHDLAAATAMSQIRASLRAFGWRGEPPADVLGHVAQLLAAFDLADLVTVFYGVLGPPAADGGRLLTYANAGHLPPLVQAPDGSVRSLDGGMSVVLGAPIDGVRIQANERLTPGSTLLLFTDGLVEVPGEGLDTSLARLGDLLAGHPPRHGVERLCELVVRALAHDGRQDDIAVLAIQTSVGPRATEPPSSQHAPRLEGQSPPQ